MDWAWRWRPEDHVHVAQAPSKYLGRFYYDCITHDEHALRYLIDSVGIDRVCLGQTSLDSPREEKATVTNR